MIEFTKMHGIGNDFIVVDALSESWSQPRAPAASIELNDRRLGVGGDGLILVERGEQAPFRMRMFNPDGSESEMCGNGVRCVAKFVRDRGHTQEASMPIETGAGVLELQVLQDSRVRVNMGIARLDRSEIPVAAEGEGPFVEQPLTLRKVTLCATCVSLGNPHAVVFVPDAASVPIGEWGPEIETHPLFPARINAHFVQVLSRSELVQRTWERGAGATLACGTGACASAVAGFLTGRSDRHVRVQLPGGTLEIEYGESGTVWMTGPAESVFEGIWPD